MEKATEPNTPSHAPVHTHTLKLKLHQGGLSTAAYPRAAIAGTRADNTEKKSQLVVSSKEHLHKQC